MSMQFTMYQKVYAPSHHPWATDKLLTGLPLRRSTDQTVDTHDPTAYQIFANYVHLTESHRDFPNVHLPPFTEPTRASSCPPWTLSPRGMIPSRSANRFSRSDVAAGVKNNLINTRCGSMQ